MPHFGGIFLQKLNKTIFLITIVLVFLFCFTAVSANDEASIIGDSSSTDDIAVADVAVDASGDAQTIDNDASYGADGIIVNVTGDSDRNSETVLGSGPLAEGGTNSFTNLANNIENAGSYLPLSGNYAYDSTLDTEYADGITISKNITIKGGGSTTISGSDLARIFNIENGFNVVLLDITFINGHADNGGAIYNDGNLVLKDCEFQDNSADYGAAIYNSAYATLTGDAKFEGNVATYRGGGIYSEGTVDLSDSVFDSNDITYRARNDDNGGAAIYNKGGTLTLDNVDVTNNLIDIEIRDGNSGHLINAAIFTSGDTTITNSVISNNSGSYGGGIYVTNGATLDVSGTTFENNMATFGAAIYDEGAKVIVDDCDFIENHCEGIGSAGTSSTQAAAILVMSQGASASITDSRFNRNSAKTGGAVSISQADGDVLIENCNFTENTASYEGGAIYNYAADGASLTVKDSTFTDNTATNWGDAISNDAGLKLEGNTISGDINTAIGNWLGTVDTTVKVTILDGLAHTITTPAYALTATVTDDNGNPIMDHNFVFTIGEEVIAATYNATEGVYKATYTFKNPGTYTISTSSYDVEDVTTSTVTFESPLKALQDLITAAINAGETSLDLSYGFSYIAGYDSAYAATGIVIPSDFTINGNGVTIDGGNASRLFTVNAGKLTLNNVVLANGKADDGAAVYVASGAKLDATSTTFEDNVATYSGGAIYTEGGEIALTNCILDSNDVTDVSTNNDTGGAAIYAKNAQVTLVNTNVTNNGKSTLDRSNGDLINGVIELLNTETSISGGLLENNTGIYGGAIYAGQGGTLTVTGATFNNNKAYNGGAIDIEGVTTTISGSNFNNNWVVGPGSQGYYGAGGAISAGLNKPITISDSTFTGNKATGEGAWAGAVGVAIGGDASASITGCTFTDNTAQSKADDIFNSGYLSLEGNTITGQGIVDNGQITTAIKVIFMDNEAKTYEAFDTVDAYAKLTDDNGNIIRTNSGTITLVLTGFAQGFGGTVLGFNEEDGLYHANVTPTKTGMGATVSNPLKKEFPSVVVESQIITVTPVDRILEVTFDNVAYPNDVVFNVKLTREKDGALLSYTTVNITIGEETKSVSTRNGVGTITFTGLEAGNYEVTAKIAGSASYNPVEKTYDLTVFEKTGTFSELQSLINSAETGSTIQLTHDIVYDSVYDADKFPDGIIVNKALTIVGGEGIEICGNDLVRVFKLADDAVLQLEDLTICDGAAEKGAGVYVDAGATLNANDVTFIDNVAVKRGGAIYSEGTVNVDTAVFDKNDITFRSANDDNGGAAIYNNGGTLTVNNANITNNLLDIVIRDGNDGHLINAVVFTNGDATITDSYFANNTGSWGAGIYVTGDATLTVRNTTFEGNNATFGASIYDEGAKIIVDNCTFNDNNALGVGSPGTSSTQAGAILVMSSGASATITDSKFNRNTAITGGAVSFAGVGEDSLIEGCIFTNNTASDGGAVYLWTSGDAAVTVKGSTFTGNTADWGNAISTDGALKLEENTISTTSADIGNWGGSIESKVIAVILSNDTYNWHMDAFVINATLTDDNGNLINDHFFNFVLSKEGAEDILVPATFNTSLGYYQGVFTPADAGTYLIGIDYAESEVQTSVVEISRTLSDLANLIANDEDGRIELDGDYSYVAEFDAALKDGIVIDEVTTIIGNGFTICGEDSARIFYVNSSILNLENLTICHGAAEKGAGVYVDAGSIFVADGVTFTENVAVKRGGAIYSEGTVDIKNSVIDSNDITFRTKNDDNGGAAIYNLNGVLNIEKTNITNNLKDIVIRNGNAGDLLVGVVVTSGETTIIDSYFANNTGSWGGAISSLGYLNDDPYTLTVTGTTFEGNNATFGGAIYVESSNLAVDDCTFNNNKGVGVGSSGTSNTQGGAIVIHPSDSKATITNSRFNKNSANVGGAVSLAGVDQDSLIEGCTFTENTANDGGAIYLWTQDYAAVTVKDSTFSGNTAGWGNAISTDGALKLEGNTISTTSADIGNYYGSIESKVIVQILGNDTTEGAGIVEATFGETVPIYAVITDDNGNLIKDISLVFTISSNAGTKSVEATYNDDTNKYEAEYDIESAGKNLVSITSSADEFLVINTGLIDVAKVDVTLTINVEDIYEGQKAVVTGQIIGIDDTGIAADIIVVVNDVDYNITTTVEENGTFSFEIPDLTAGNYGAFAIFLGDNNYNYGYASDLFNVKERQLAVVITNLDDLQNFVYGDQVTLDFTVTDAITGEAVTGADILITNYDDADISYKDEEGNYQVNLGMLKPGDYELSAFFKVEGYEPLTYEPINVKVSKADIDVIVNRINDTITYGQDETIFVGTNNTAFEGTISITLINYYNGTEIVSFNVTLDPEDDVVQELGGLLVDLSDLNAGKYNITAEFEGNDGYNADEVTIQEPYNTFEVKKAGTILIIEVPSVNVGDDIPISVLLYDEFNNPISGDVYLEVPGIETPLVVEVVNGEGELTVTNTLARNTDYEVTAVFRSTTNYEASDDSDKFDVIGLHTEIIIEPVEGITYGTETEGTFTIVDGEGNPIADLDEDVIAVSVDDTPVDVIIRDGVGTYTIPANLAVGPHTVTVVFVGDNKYAGSDATATVVVNQASSLVTITAPSEIVYGDALTVDTALTSDGQAITGDVAVVVTDAEGNVVDDLSKLDSGVYTITATFAGNDNYLGSEATATVVVKQATSLVTITAPSEITYGDELTVDTALTSGGEIIDGDVAVVVKDDGGNVVDDLTKLGAGSYTITATFAGNDNYLGDEATATVVVKQASSVVTITAPSEITYGDELTVDTALTSGGEIIDGDVAVVVKDDGGNVVDDLTKLGAGSYTITATFAGNDNYLGDEATATVVVKQASSVVTITAPSEITYGDELTVDTALTSGGEIIDGDVAVVVKDDGGNVVDDLTKLGAGSYTITATFAGNDNYLGDEATATVVVKQASSVVTITAPSEIVYGDALTVGTALTSDGQAIAGDVAVVVKDADGVVVDDLTKLPAGSYTITATFAGNDNYIGSEATATVVVNPADVEVSVSVAQPIAYGENATVTITVTTPAGEKLNEVVDVYGLPGVETVTLADGTVTFDVPNLDAREYTIWVKFPETQNYAASSSNIVVFTVDQAVPVITVFDSTTEYGVAGTVNVTSDVSGYYYVTINGVTTIIEIAAGSNSSVAGPSDVVPGSYDVTVAYKETTNYAASSKVFEGKYVVTKKEETVVLSVNDVSCAEIPSVSSNAPDYLDENVVYMVYDKNGVEVYRTEAAKLTDVTALKALAEGTYTIDAEYVDELYDVEFVPAEFKVSKADSKITITAPSEITYGDALAVGTELTSGGEVIDGVVSVVVTDAEGNVVADLSKLDAGVYAITATFDGDDVYAGTEVTATVVVKQAESSIVVNPIPEINAGETQSITVTVGPEGVDGTVKVIVTGEGYSFTHEYAVSKLAELITLSDLPAGDYSINAIFNVGSNYELSTASADFTVKSIDVDAKVNATLINFGDSVTVTIEGLPADVPATDLNITDNGKEIAVALNGNEFVYAPAESGDHVIAINYIGTACNKFSCDVSFTVAPEGEYIVIPANNSAEAVQEAINNAPAGATIKLADNTTYDLAGIELNNSVTIVGGEGTVITVPAGQSSAFVAAANASDVNIKNIKFVATSDNQSLLSVTPNDLGGGISQVPAITIENVTAIPAAGVNESTISLLNVNTNANPFKPSSDVSISKNIIASGVNSLKTNASALSGNVALKKAVQTTLTGANTQNVYAIPYKAAKSGKYYTVTLKDANGNVLANKTVKFTLAGKTYTVKTDAKGVAKLAINIYKPGTYKLAVSFAGESTLGASSKQATIKILKNKVKITRKTKKVKRSAKKRTLKYYVKTKTGKKMGIKGVKVYLKINKKTYKAKTNKKGLVKFKVKLPRIKKTYKVKVTFKGNKANKKRTLKTKVKVY